MEGRYILRKPKYYPKIPDWSNKVYMPVSMNNRLIKDKETLHEILKWIFERTNQCDAIIGSYLHRHNIMIDGTSENDAIQKSEIIGSECVAILNKEMKLFPNKILNIRYAKEFYDNSNFYERLHYFRDLYENNSDFCSEIQYLIHQFLERQGHIEWSVAQINHSTDYLLEELVIFEMLAENGYLINIYPGKQLRVFKSIVKGKLQNVSIPLSKVSLVEMRFKPESASKYIKQFVETQKNRRE